MSLIDEQLEMAVEYLERQWPSAREQAKQVSELNQEYDQILIGGCGDSHHAALGMEMAMSKLSGRQVNAMDAMSLGRYAPLTSGGKPRSTLVIGISASGEVARTIEALEIWRATGAQTLAFTQDPGSRLAQAADLTLALEPPLIQHGPGVLSYLGSLLLGYATAAYLAGDGEQERIDDLIRSVPGALTRWIPGEVDRAEHFASGIQDGIAVFLGAGPAQSSARFGAAKVIEAAGERCWAQDVEEWAHLEYFCEPETMTTLLLSSGGRAESRETEILTAMAALGREVLLSRWQGGEGWTSLEREALAPLLLWVAPCSYASTRARLISQTDFRGFSGGRDRVEGGGVSRIRSSESIQLVDLSCEGL